jgi:hypothetical protein
MSIFTKYWHPVLAVPCTSCEARAGIRCKRPSGHDAADFHKDRKSAADDLFIKMHGENATIQRTDSGRWVIDPDGMNKIAHESS